MKAFFSRKIGYEALFSVPNKHLVDSGAKLKAALSQMAAQGVPAEATFHERMSSIYQQSMFYFFIINIRHHNISLMCLL